MQARAELRQEFLRLVSTLPRMAPRPLSEVQTRFLHYNHPQAACFYCGRSKLPRWLGCKTDGSSKYPPAPNYRTRDHLTPRAWQQKGQRALKVVACFHCNQLKGCQTLAAFRKQTAVLLGVKVVAFAGEILERGNSL